jgi:hypothetical protein
MAMNSMAQVSGGALVARGGRGSLTKWARSRRSACGSPRSMRKVARTLLTIRGRAPNAPAFRFSTAEIATLRARAQALLIEADAWAASLARKARRAA